MRTPNHECHPEQAKRVGVTPRSLRAQHCRLVNALVFTAALIPSVVHAQSGRRLPLGAAEIDDIARLEMLEDRRQFDAPELARILASPHPELRRRAAQTVARIADKRGIALLRSRPLDADTAVAATVVFAVGQLRDSSTITWFDSLLANDRTPPTISTEAATALGKIKTAAAREVLARYLSRATANARTTATIGEALLALGRSTSRGDNAPIVRWVRAPSEALRWRAVWALFRPRDPAAVPVLLAASADRSALVRSWAVRGLTKPQADSAHVGDKAESLLLAATRDTDRRVRTEAVRALGTYADSVVIAALLEALTSNDSWIAVSAAEGLGRIRSAATRMPLRAATDAKRPCALRLTAMQALQNISAHDAIAAAVDITRDTVPYCRATALSALMRDTTGSASRQGGRVAADALLDDPIPATRLLAWQAHFTFVNADLDVTSRRVARTADLASPDIVRRAAALRAMSAWADSSDLPSLLDAYERATRDTSTVAASAAVSAIAAVQRRGGLGAAMFLSRFSPPANRLLRRDIDRAFGAAVRQAWPAIQPVTRELADYRLIVERWVVPDYQGRPRPHARWETPRGAIEIELYPGDAPLAVDDFVRAVETGAIVGTEFTRVVPDFVNQQQTVRDRSVLRDEVNRKRLTRANLSWATAGLDTGAPGYTIGHTPQPHNEGDFTSMGRVVRGMDAMDRIELGDRVLAARMLTGGAKP